MKNIPNGNRPGLYLIARFEKKPSGAAIPDMQEILYIGETHGKSQSISKRLHKFLKASQIGGMLHKHSGGNRFNRLMGNDTSNIYAAGYAPIIKEERLLVPFILYTERKLIWEYVVKWNKMPFCNGK